MKKKFHLAWFGSMGPIEWSNTPSYPLYDFAKGDVYLDVARMAERAKMDLLFFADGSEVPRAYGDGIEWYVKNGVQICHDPLPALAAMSTVTKNLGLGATMSTSYYPPFLLARLLATMDNMSGGRMAWNVVTSTTGGENFGITLPEHDTRYDIADEYMDLVGQLWRSWDKDALVLDKKSGIFADPKKVREVNFVGKYFKSRGPLTVHASPQQRPVIIMAGVSPRGQRFAVENAEMVIVHKSNVPDMRKYSDNMRTQLAAVGRERSSLKIFFSIKPIMGETEAIARELQKHQHNAANLEEGLADLSFTLGYDLSQFDLDEPLPADLEPRGIVGKHLAIKAGPPVPLRELAMREARKETLEIVGSYDQVADTLEKLAVDADADGFHFRAVVQNYPYLVEVATKLIPILQERGLVRTEYSGGTLRDNLFEF